MNKNILITGGAGFIGSRLALKLLKKGYSITVLDNLSKQIHGDHPTESFLYRSIRGQVTFINGDVRNRKDWERAILEQDAIIHLAAETGTGQSMYEIHKYTDVNIGGTALMLDVLTNLRHSIKKIIVASSRAIYGEGRYHCVNDGDVYPHSRRNTSLAAGDFNCKCPKCGGDVDLLPTDEDSKIMPQSIYGISKYNQEQLTLVGGKSLNIPAVALRYQNVYGPGQSLSNPYTGILSIFSTQIKNNNDLNIYEDGLESRDFVYIDDIVDATILALENDAANYQTYNVGSGQAASVLKVAEWLVANYNSNVNIRISGNFRIGDIRHNYASLSRIHRDLGFVPAFNFERGLSQFVQWVESQKISKDNYSESMSELKSRGLLQ